MVSCCKSSKSVRYNLRLSLMQEANATPSSTSFHHTCGPSPPPVLPQRRPMVVVHLVRFPMVLDEDIRHMRIVRNNRRLQRTWLSIASLSVAFESRVLGMIVAQSSCARYASSSFHIVVLNEWCVLRWIRSLSQISDRVCKINSLVCSSVLSESVIDYGAVDQRNKEA